MLACVGCMCATGPRRNTATGPVMDRESTGLPWDGALSTKSGGMSYQMLDSADPAHELDVIKAVLLREVGIRHRSHARVRAGTAAPCVVPPTRCGQ